jgi:hypothetical protein
MNGMISRLDCGHGGVRGPPPDSCAVARASQFRARAVHAANGVWAEPPPRQHRLRVDDRAVGERYLSRC